MRLSVFVIYDAAAEAYLPPFYFHQPAQAWREFAIRCNDPSSPFHHSPGDYTVFQIGYWDDETAVFHQHEQEKLVNGVEAASYFNADNFNTEDPTNA